MADRPTYVWTGSGWDTIADPGAVRNSLVSNTKGAVPVGTGSAVAALSPGTNGEILYADSSATNGLRYQPVYSAGRNHIINGDFSVWQRGTSFTPATDTYTADRWVVEFNGTGATRTISRQAFTAGTAPVAGYEGTYFLRFDQSVAGSGGTFNLLEQRIEDVRTFAGQTVTVSFWAKAAANTTLPLVNLAQVFGLSGSPTVQADLASNVAVTTSWQRFSYTVTLGSIAGKTINAGHFLRLDFRMPLNATFTIDLWGVQVEAGNVATRFEEEPFEATLRKCQRYYVTVASGNDLILAVAQAFSSSAAGGNVTFPVIMRAAPTVTVSSAAHFSATQANGTPNAAAGFTASKIGTRSCLAEFTGITGSPLVLGDASCLFTSSASAVFSASAEL